MRIVKATSRCAMLGLFIDNTRRDWRCATTEEATSASRSS
jgi:hypothetical protein